MLKTESNTPPDDMPPPTGNSPGCTVVPPASAYALFAALGLVVVVFAIFGAAVGFGFLNWDDNYHVVDNPNVNPPSWHGVWESWRAPYYRLYVPLSYTFLSLEAAAAQQVDPVSGVSELRPAVFHLGNLFLHAACTVLVFMLLRRLLDATATGTGTMPAVAPAGKFITPTRSISEGALAYASGWCEQLSRRGNTLAAALGALLFAVHPLQVESVAWISEVRGLLCGLFSLLALWQYVEYADPRRRRAVRAALYAGATAALALALLSKPAAAAVPLMAGVIGVGLLRRRCTAVFLETLPWLLLATAAVLETRWLQLGGAKAVAPSLAMRPLVALDAISFYVGKFFVPFSLAADYGRTPQFVFSATAFQIGWVLLPALAIVLVLAKHRRVPLVGLALFAAWLAPVLGVVSFDYQRISTVADRYAYLAMLGPALVLAWIIQRWWSVSLAAGAAAAIGLLAALSFVQLGTWRDTGTLFQHVLRVNPRSAVAQYHLGYQAFLVGDRKAAIEHYRQSLDLRPDFVETYRELARTYIASGEVEEACKVLRGAPHCDQVEEVLQAIQSKQQGLREATAEVQLGRVEEAAGRIDESRRHYLAAIRIQPRRADAHYNLGNLALKEGNLPAAIEYYETALKFQPEYSQARANLGAVLLQLGRFDDAIAQERAALIIDPALFQARVLLGQALLLKGSKPEAAAQFRTALSQVPHGSPQAIDLHNWLRKAEGP